MIPSIRTLESTPLATGGPNALTEIDFGQLQNARVTQNGQSVTLPTGTTVTTFTVQRVVAGQSTMVPFTIKDGCGPRQTVAGGGASAGF